MSIGVVRANSTAARAEASKSLKFNGRTSPACCSVSLSARLEPTVTSSPSLRAASRKASAWYVVVGNRRRSRGISVSHARLMKCLQLSICLHDHGEFTYDVRNVHAGNRIVTLVVPQSGVHAVADAAEARGR